MRSLSQSKKPARRPVSRWKIAGGVAALSVIAALGGLVSVRPDLVEAQTARLAERFNDVAAQTERALGLNVAEVTVSGREQTDTRALLAAIGLKRGDAILAFDAAAARERIERIDWVDRATVQRLLPDRVHVEIEERRPFAIWQLRQERVLIDAEGHPIAAIEDDSAADAYAQLPFVVGHGAADRAAEIVALMQGEPELAARVTAFVRVSDRRWNLRLENGVDVMLPEKNTAHAIADVARLDRTHRLLSRDIVAVDMRLSDRIGVRLSEEVAEMRAKAAQTGNKALIGGRGPKIRFGGSET